MAESVAGLEIYRAPEKKYQEPIVMVPFFGGNSKLLKRHIELVTQWGYDVYFVQLDFKMTPTRLPISADLQFGMKHLWADHVEKALNSVASEKIVFSLSNPSAAVIEALARRNCLDIKAYICDSGPAANLLKSIYNLYTYLEPVKFLPLRLAKSALGTVLLAPKMLEELDQELERFPAGFPILSIRGWKDKLISPSQIDRVFEPHKQLAWQKLSLPEAEHLTGLKDFPNEYIPALQKFLSEHSTAISS
jgi:hypothetical protein